MSAMLCYTSIPSVILTCRTAPPVRLLRSEQNARWCRVWTCHAHDIPLFGDAVPLWYGWYGFQNQLHHGVAHWNIILKGSDWIPRSWLAPLKKQGVREAWETPKWNSSLYNSVLPGMIRPAGWIELALVHLRLRLKNHFSTIWHIQFLTKYLLTCWLLLFLSFILLSKWWKLVPRGPIESYQYLFYWYLRVSPSAIGRIKQENQTYSLFIWPDLWA